MRFIYLHGFASSPTSRKARLFIEKFAARGIDVQALDLAPDFAHLTLSSQLEIIDKAVDGEPSTLIGSSMGGYLAALYAAGHVAVERLVLLAPAFNFYQLWMKRTDPETMQVWREKGSVSVFHYGTGTQQPLSYHLIEDARHYPAFPDLDQPCLILHGAGDEVVPFSQSAEFAATHPNASLIELATGHEMTDKLDEIWNHASTFLLAEA